MRKIAALLIFSLVLAKSSVSFGQKNQEKMKTLKDSGYAPVNGLKMYYEIHGSGEPLVLIHGGGSTIGTTFGRLIPLLADRFMLIAVELQAHGHTADRDKPTSFEQDADDVAALLKYLEIFKADVFGFSNGGSTAIQLGIRHPQMINKLVIASASYKREGMIKGFFEGMKNANLGNMPDYLKEAFLAINNDTAKLLTMFNRDKTRMLEFKDVPDADIASIKAPSLIIAGDRDVVTASHCAQMASIIPNAQLLIVPGDHGSFMLEGPVRATESNTPKLVLSVIEEFLKK